MSTQEQTKYRHQYYLDHKDREKEMMRLYYETHKEQRLIYNIGLKERNRVRVNAYQRKAYSKNKSYYANYQHKYIQANPDKYVARLRVRDALRKGLITKGLCEICGSSKVQAHHEDYSKQLEVRWLCPKHHKRIHAETQKKQESRDKEKE